MADPSMPADGRLRRSDNLRRLAGELALVGGWSVEAGTGQVYWSEEIFRILDWPEGDAPALETIMHRYPPDSRERLEAALSTCLTDGTPFDLELEIETFAGRRIPVVAIAEAERDQEGRILRVNGAFQDISDLARATSEAEAAARRLTTTLESMTDAIYTLDRDWRFTYVNARAGELLRQDRDSLLGHSVWEAFPEAIDSPLYPTYHRAMELGETQVLKELHYPPLETWFSVHAYPSEQGLAVYFRDVTDRHHARAALAEREVLLRRQAALLDEAQDAIVVFDLDDRITYWNHGAERLYGWSSDDAVGRDARTLFLDEASRHDLAKASVLDDGRWDGEEPHRSRDGEQLTVASRWSLIREDDGTPEAILAINTDVTEQRRTEQQLLRAQRMESLGTLAGGVAHDLNNVLSPILLATELLQLRHQDETDTTLLDTISSSARRGADLVTQVLSFARGVEGRRAPVDVAVLLEDVRSIVRDTFPKDIRMSLDVASDLGIVVGDSTQIQQVLLNLAVNARDAMPRGGHLSVTATNVTLDAQYAASTPGTAPGDYLRIEVEDEGSGMTAEVRERVFEPFFTTKPQGAGTGLGLSTAAAIVRSHDGVLNVYSEPGSGTRFHIYLPRAGRSERGPVHRDAEPGLPRGHGETVLVVDDEEAVRTMTRQTLQAHGYAVLEAADGAEAVSVFAEHRDRVAVVLTDMMMPIMDGPASIRALQRLDPDVRIVGASGLHANGKVAQATSAGVHHFLPKPYTSRRLLEVLADILGRAD